MAAKTAVLGEDRDNRNARLKNLGLWDAFNARRRALLKEGMDRQEAYKATCVEFAASKVGKNPIDAPAKAAEKVKKVRPKLWKAGPKPTAKEIMSALAIELSTRFAEGNECARWVANFMEVPWHDVYDAKDTIPGGAAISMLATAKVSGADFLKGIYVKAEIDRKALVSDRFSDDGRELLKLTDKIRKLKQKAIADASSQN